MKDVVVDVSLALKWVVDEDDSDAADALLVTWQQQGIRRLVPCWFACELGNALHQQARRGAIAASDAFRFVRVAMSLVTVLDPDPEVAVRGVQIASQLGQRATYDAQYLALAERVGCVLWTADRRFAQAAQPAFPFVRWLGQSA